MSKKSSKNLLTFFLWIVSGITSRISSAIPTGIPPEILPGIHPGISLRISLRNSKKTTINAISNTSGNFSYKLLRNSSGSFFRIRWEIFLKGFLYGFPGDSSWYYSRNMSQYYFKNFFYDFFQNRLEMFAGNYPRVHARFLKLFCWDSSRSCYRSFFRS